MTLFHTWLLILFILLAGALILWAALAAIKDRDR